MFLCENWDCDLAFFPPVVIRVNVVDGGGSTARGKNLRFAPPPPVVSSERKGNT